MKKFLSLVLALVMTMSLVTIGAGATEYKDFTDKGEVKYAEAVAVLNKIGIIAGYEDGTIRPTTALTRGAAAKIIVSLMIGPAAAENLPATAAPYKDVPVTNTFAGVIAYCKTAGYISGYSDGTFRPTGALTGYAFSKMLLGALGYDGDVEGFTGSGWTMNVARLGNKAGMFNRLDFVGNNGVTREAACQLALNTLKATEVEYVGNSVNVTGKDINVSVGNNKYDFSDNRSSTDGNIKSDTLMQFAEEHFKDLKQLGDTTTTFGRPATRWSYKNVTIDKFAKNPDFDPFTAAPSGDTAKDKVKDLGLDGYKVYGKTNVTINDAPKTNYFGTTTKVEDAVKANDSTVAQKLVNLFGNGIVVEIYLDDDNADIISDIVVIRTQLMEVNTVSSKTITLKKLDEVGGDTSDSALDPVTNSKFFQNISSVKDDDDAFADLKSCKSGDYMLVTYTGKNATKDADSAKAPTVVTGALTAITRNNKNVVNGITVGGTAYKLAAIRDDDFATLNAANISATKKDVTLYLDAYGYATYIKDAGTSNNFMILGDSYQTLTNGKLVTTLTGWDLKGTEVSINVGTLGNGGAQNGDLIKYQSTSSGNADYAVVTSYTGITDSNGNAQKGYLPVDTSKEIKAGATTVKADSVAKEYTIASGVKTIFVDFDDDNTVKSVYVKNGVANVTTTELKAFLDLNGNGVQNTEDGQMAQMYLNKDGGVEAIVVKTTSSDTVSDKVLYIESVKGDSVVDGVRTYTYHVWVDGAEDDYTSTDKVNAGQFASYAETANGNYKLSNVTKTDTATSSFNLTIDKGAINTTNKNLVYGINNGTYDVTVVEGSKGLATDLKADSTLNTTGATFADLTDHGFASMKDVYDFLNSAEGDGKKIDLTFVMNNKDKADDQYKVSAIAITDIH